MQITETTQSCAVAMGLFDGVHIGHRAVLQAAVQARSEGLLPAVFTFWTASVERKHGNALSYLYTDAVKHRLLQKNGIQRIVCPPFPATLDLDGETFCREFLQKRLHAKRVFCGRNFRFGSGASCTVEDLQQFGMQMNFTVEVVEAVKQEEEVISSSRIRKELMKGNPEKAALLLGASYQMIGIVEYGKQLGNLL